MIGGDVIELYLDVYKSQPACDAVKALLEQARHRDAVQ